MSILKYFKRVDSKSRPSASVLPDPTGPLSSSISPTAISSANERVADVIDASVNSKKGSRGSYQILTWAQKLLVARRAAKYGTTAAMKFFAKKYPELSNRLKGTTVRRLKNLYQDSRKGDTPSEKDFEEFSSKKNGCPLKIGENLDKQVMEYVSYMRSTGTAVNTAVVMSCAEGILMHEDASMLSRVDLNKGWAQYLLHRMGFVKRKATTKAKVSVENFAELKSDYLLKIKNIIAMDEIPAELVINFDQTALNIVPTSDWTMEAEGNKRVEIIAKDDKRQITAVLAGTLNGDFLPCQIIYQGTTTRCLPKYDFPNNWNITYSANY